LAEGQVCYIEAAPQRYQIYNGTAFKDFHVNYTDISSTQTFTGFTKGNATVVSKYARLGDFVHFWGNVVLGSTSSMAGPLDIGLPFTAEQGIFFHPNAALYYDTSPGTVYWAVSINIGTTALRIPGIITSGTTATNYDVGAATPFTWANGDSFFWNHFFKVA